MNATPIGRSCSSHSKIVDSFMWRPPASTARGDARQRQASSDLHCQRCQDGDRDNATPIEAISAFHKVADGPHTPCRTDPREGIRSRTYPSRTTSVVAE